MKRTNTPSDALNRNKAVIDVGDGLPAIELPLDGNFGGTKGDPGEGVPTGGAPLQVVRKNVAGTTTEWATPSKDMVGLSNVDNTADVNKPISAATQIALDEKASATSLTNGLSGKADLSNGKVPISQLPTDALVTEAKLPDEVDGVNKNLIEDPASLTAGALSAAIDELATKPAHRIFQSLYAGNNIVTLGDSITAGGWPIVASVKSDQRVRVIRNAGISGNTLTQMIARIQADVIDYAPDACTVLGGINDVLSLGNTAAQVIAKLETVYNLLTAAHIVPIPCTLTPHDSVPRQAVIAEINAWITNYADKNGYDLLDFWTLMADPATNGFKAGYTTDSLHPTTHGYAIMAQYASDYLSPRLPRNYPSLTVSDTNALNLIPNQLYLTDANADALPEPWIGLHGTAGTYAHALVNDPAIPGNWAQVTMTDAPNTRHFAWENASDLHPEWADAGDLMSFACRVDLSGSDTAAGVTIEMRIFGAPVMKLTIPVSAEGVKGIVYGEGVIPAGWTGRVGIYMISPQGTGVYKYAQPTLYNLTRMRSTMPAL